MRKRGNKTKKKYPIFYSARIVIIALILFYFLTNSIFINIFIKTSISLLSQKKIDFSKLDFSEEKPLAPIFKLSSSIFRIAFLQILIFFVIAIPFKVYFYRKKRNLDINKKIHNFVKKILLLTPWIYSLIFFILSILSIYISTKTIELNELQFPNINEFAIDIEIISIIASFVSAIFIHSWQKFRVQQYYMTYVFEEDELRFFKVKPHFTSIKYKLMISNIVTTFLPLLFLFFTVYLNVSHLEQVGKIDKDQLKLIFGSFSKIIQIQGYDTLDFYEQINIAYQKFPALFNYYSSLDTVLMYFTIISSIISALIYIFIFLRFNTVSIVKPIERLVTNMEKVSNHDFNAFTYVETTDEIGQMVVGFNKMLVGLNEKEKIRDLFGQYLTKEISDKILTSDVNLEGELYEATILFSDIRDFTKITQNITPVETIQFLNDYFNEMIEVAVKYEGIIDKFIGDGMLVVFGIPFQKQDHATKALNASIEMQKALSLLNQKRETEGKFPIKMGIGLHSGQILAGNIGNKRKLQYTVIGDTVNVASRIESLNKDFSSTILLSEDTYKKLELNQFDINKFKIHENVEIRGKSGKFNLYSYQS